jgi:hypothetical protein
MGQGNGNIECWRIICKHKKQKMADYFFFLTCSRRRSVCFFFFFLKNEYHYEESITSVVKFKFIRNKGIKIERINGRNGNFQRKNIRLIRKKKKKKKKKIK